MLNNNCVRKCMLPSCSLGFPAIQFFSCYVCIKLHDTMSLPALAFYFLIYGDAIILTTSVFTASSYVFITSRKLLARWRTEWKMTQNSELRRSFRACSPMKVRFGDNFVDNSTPLVIQDTCTRQTVSSLLISQ